MKIFRKTKTHQPITSNGLTIATQNEPIPFVRKKCRQIAFYEQNFEKVWFFFKKGVITFSHFVLWTFSLLNICWPMDGQQGVVPPWNRSDQCVTSYGTLNLKNTSLTPFFDHFQNIISQRQIVVEQRALAYWSHRMTYFPHAATCNTSCVDEVGLFGQKPSKNGK